MKPESQALDLAVRRKRRGSDEAMAAESEAMGLQAGEPGCALTNRRGGQGS